MLRVLMIPRIELIDGRGSVTLRPLRYMRTVLAKDTAPLFTLVVRERFADKKWLKEYGWQDEDLDKIEFLPVPEAVLGGSLRSRRLGYTLGGALFNLLGPSKKASRFFDVIWSEAFPSHGMIRTAMQGLYSNSKVPRVPLVGWWHWNVTEASWKDSGGKNSLYNEFDPIAESFGALFCDQIVCGSTKTYAQLSAWFRKYMNAATCSKMLGRMHVQEFGVPVDEIPEGTYSGDRAPVGLWSGYYGVDYVCVKNALLRALSVGALSEVILQFCSWPWETTAIDEDEGRQVIAELGKIEGVTVVGSMKHTEYLQMLQKADMFVAFAEGSYGLRFGEMLAAGCLPVLNRSLAEIFLPRDYPFVVDKETELDKAVRVVARHLKKHPEIKTKLTKEFRAYHNCDQNVPKIHGILVDEVCRAREMTSFGEFGGLVTSALRDVREGDILTHADACELISKKTRTGMDLRNNAMFTPNFIRWAVLMLGFNDVGDFDQVRYQKVSWTV